MQNMTENANESTTINLGGKNTLNYVMLALVTLVLVISVMQAFAINSLTNDLQASGVSVKGITSASGGETYEQMMARMHPDQVQSSAAASAGAAGSGMVGGC